MLLNAFFWAAFLAPASAASEPAATESAGQAQSPARNRAAEIVHALGQGNFTSAAAFLEGEAAPEAARKAAPLLDRVRYTAGQPQLHSIEEAGPNSAKIVYRSSYTGRLGALLLEVEPAAPHRIVSLAPTKAPEEAAVIPAAESERLAAIDAVVQRLSDADVISGVVLIAKEGQPIYQRAFGLADRTFGVPNRIDTKFNLGSMNKMLTAIAIGQLVEAGKVSLDDPLSKYLPDFPDPESAKKIQIRHLLTHTSGLGNYFNQEFWRSSRGRFRTIPDYMEVARANAAMEFEPGSRWSYSNTGMLVLGRVIEIASGEDYYDYIRKHIYEPAGMADTDSFETDAVVPNRATGYETKFSPEGRELKTGILATPVRGSPAGGGYSTAPDLLRLANALSAGKLLKPETLAVFTAPRPELNSPTYGYGFQIARGLSEPRDIVGHGGDMTDGTCANFAMIRDAESPYTAVVLTNGTLIGACHPLFATINEMFPAKAQ